MATPSDSSDVTSSRSDLSSNTVIENTTSNVLITSHKLGENNYLQWSQSVRLFICGKGKLGYIDGKMVVPSKTYAKAYRTWEIENSIVMSWLITR